MGLILAKWVWGLHSYVLVDGLIGQPLLRWVGAEPSSYMRIKKHSNPLCCSGVGCMSELHLSTLMPGLVCVSTRIMGMTGHVVDCLCNC